jgi:hypothetical protein
MLNVGWLGVPKLQSLAIRGNASAGLSAGLTLKDRVEFPDLHDTQPHAFTALHFMLLEGFILGFIALFTSIEPDFELRCDFQPYSP